MGSSSTKSTAKEHTTKACNHERKKKKRGSSEEHAFRSATPESSQADPKPTVSPPSKKHKPEFSVSTITEEEVKRYLQRRPITSRDLVRKFINKKTGMDRRKIVEVLHHIIERLQNVQKKMMKDKLYLSLASTGEF